MKFSLFILSFTAICLSRILSAEPTLSYPPADFVIKDLNQPSNLQSAGTLVDFDDVNDKNKRFQPTSSLYTCVGTPGEVCVVNILLEDANGIQSLSLKTSELVSCNAKVPIELVRNDGKPLTDTIGTRLCPAQLRFQLPKDCNFITGSYAVEVNQCVIRQTVLILTKAAEVTP